MKLNQNSKRQQKAILILLISFCITNQQEVKKVNEFYITKIEKNSVDTTRPLSDQRDSISVNEELNSTGTLYTSWKNDQIIAEVYYRENRTSHVKTSRIITVKFPFKREDEYQEKDLFYSTSADTNALYRLDEKAITHHLIDQELYIFNGEDLNSGYLLRNIRTNIHVEVKVDDEGNESYHPQVKNYEVYFEDGRFVYHIQITEEMHSKYDMGTLWVILLFIFGILSAVMTPTFCVLILHGFFQKHQLKMNFIAIQLYHLGLTLSIFILFKYASGFGGYFLIFIMFFVIAATRMMAIAMSLENIQSGESLRSKGYLVVVVGAYLGWLIALAINTRLFLRGLGFCSFLAMIDLIFMRRSISLSRKIAYEAWAVVMVQVVFPQLFIYCFYIFCYWSVHTGAPSIFTECVLPDLGLAAAVFLLFHLRFRLPTKFRRMLPRKMASVGYTSIDSKIAPTLCSYDHVEEIISVLNLSSYKLEDLRNIPVKNKEKKKVPQKPIDTIQAIFNLNSVKPMNSKDYVATGTLNSRPGIRYVIKGKKGWDLILRNNNESLACSSFIQHVWIENQTRRDMMAYIHTTSKRARLVSLSTRKVILNPIFDSNLNISKQGNSVLSFLGRSRTPTLITTDCGTITIQTAKYQGKGYKNVTSTPKKYFEEVDELLDRKLLERRECAVYENLVAVKYIWIDRENYEREYINKTKYQFIVIYEIDLNKKGFLAMKAKPVKCLRSITEKVFSAYRIDSFFFVDSDTLAMIMEAKIYLVDWKQKRVKKCIEIADLYAPLLQKGVEEKSIFASYWYDRIRGMVKFSVGTFTGGVSYGKEDINRYITDQDQIDVRYYYSGWFSDSAFSAESRSAKLLFSERTRPSEAAPVSRVPLNYLEPQALELKPAALSEVRAPNDIFFDEIGSDKTVYKQQAVLDEEEGGGKENLHNNIEIE